MSVSQDNKITPKTVSTWKTVGKLSLEDVSQLFETANIMVNECLSND